jgi:hypothetical protein
MNQFWTTFIGLTFIIAVIALGFASAAYVNANNIGAKPVVQTNATMFGTSEIVNDSKPRSLLTGAKTRNFVVPANSCVVGSIIRVTVGVNVNDATNVEFIYGFGLQLSNRTNQIIGLGVSFSCEFTFILGEGTACSMYSEFSHLTPPAFSTLPSAAFYPGSDLPIFDKSVDNTFDITATLLDFVDGQSIVGNFATTTVSN